MKTGNTRVKREFIQAVVKSGLSFMDVACISGIPEISLYKYAGGGFKFQLEEENRLDAILGCGPHIFKEPKGIFDGCDLS